MSDPMNKTLRVRFNELLADLMTRPLEIPDGRGGQIEPLKSASTPLPEHPAHEDDELYDEAMAAAVLREQLTALLAEWRTLADDTVPVTPQMMAAVAATSRCAEQLEELVKACDLDG